MYKQQTGKVAPCPHNDYSFIDEPLENISKVENFTKVENFSKGK